MIRKALLLSAVALVLTATSCSKDSTTSTSATTAAGASSTTTAAPASTTTAKDAKTTTTAEGDDETTTTKKKPVAKTPVTKPAKVEKIDASKLPASARNKPDNLDLSEDENDCVNTVVYEYASDDTNNTDDATMSGVLGGAIAVCVDQEKIAAAIVAGIKESAPQLTAAQAACLEGEIAGAPTDDLALFLGSFIYEGEGAEELQKPFIDALGKACNLG